MIADGDGEQEKRSMALSAGREVPLLWHRKMRKRGCTLS